MGIRALAVIVVLAISLPLTLVHPYVGVLVWNWLAYANPHQLTWGQLAQFRPAVIVALVTLFALAVSRRERFRAVGGREVLFALGFFGTLIISTVFAYHPGAARVKLEQYAKMFLMCYVMICLVNTERRFRVLVWTTALFVCALGMKGVILGPVRGFPRIYGPAKSFMSDNNDYALGMNMMLPFFAAIGATERRAKLKLFWYACLVLTVGAVLFTYSRGGYIGMGITVLAMAWRAKRKGLAAAVLGLGVILGAAFAPQRLIERVDDLENPTQQGTAKSRIRAWHVGRRMGNAHPFTGVGLRNFAGKYRDFALENDPTGALVAHSAYFQILGEAGYISLIFFVLLIVGSFWSLFRLRHRLRHLPEGSLADPIRAGPVPANPEPAPPSPAGAVPVPPRPTMRKPARPIDYLDRFRRYTHMCEISIMSYAVTATFLSRADFDLFFQVIAMVVCLKIMVRERTAQPKPEITRSARVRRPARQPVLTSAGAK